MWVAVLTTSLLLGACASPSSPPGEEGEQGAEPYTIKVASLSFPSLISAIPPIVEAKRLDEKHGFKIKPVIFSSVPAYYTSLTTGQTDIGDGGPTVAQKMFLQGGNVRIISSYTSLAPMVVVTRNPEIKTLEDLKGHSLAATVGSSEFQVLSILARARGINLQQDVELSNADPGVVLGQLARGRVDAGLLWEPNATVGLSQNDYRIVLHGSEAWKNLTGSPGFELAMVANSEFINAHPDGAKRWIAAVKDAVEFLESNPKEAARIVQQATKMEASLFEEALASGRLDYDVRPASDPQVKKAMVEMFRRSVEAGVTKKMPPDEIFYSP